MHILIRVSLGLVLIGVAAASPAKAASVSELFWLAGCWASEGAEPGSGEQWMAPAGGTLLGMSRTVKSGKTVAHEFMQIREIAPGRLAFIANPSGQAEASFPMVRLTAAEVVFENPEHDFPQRILYRLEENGLLRGRIEGLSKGQQKGVDFPMRRVPCDPAPRPAG
ncbi:MAG TPA: DUF6265 family protein [Thermoanaerobaculia bacterium]|nr:DUF6265 family protein [Thermoanaerobaculia bacterium]